MNQNIVVDRGATDVTVTVTGQAISVLPGLTFNIRRKCLRQHRAERRDAQAFQRVRLPRATYHPGR